MADNHAAPPADWPLGVARRLLPTADTPAVEPVHSAVIFSDHDQARDTARPHLAANMVATVDGQVTRAGVAAGIGSPTDLHLLRRLRAEADAVMHGVGTLRAERFTPQVLPELAAARAQRGLPPHPLGVIITGSGDLDPNHPYLTSATPAWPRHIYTLSEQAQALARPGVEVHVLQGETLDLAAVVSDLASKGVRRVVCEGGPRLLTGLLNAGLVDELFLTLAATIGGEPGALTLLAGEVPQPPRLRLRSLYEREGEIFLRYAVSTVGGGRRSRSSGP